MHSHRRTDMKVTTSTVPADTIKMVRNGISIPEKAPGKGHLRSSKRPKKGLVTIKK